ncbi:MAG TPA: APC family permease [Streptosporangiaceae bacterium]|nr:APC family permease [Streptosporangiaceae bacterium]
MTQSSGGGPDSTGTAVSAPPGNQLKAGVISLPGVLMQSVTTIAPAIAGLFTVPFIVLNAGVGAPLAYLGAFVIALLLGYVLAQFSRHMSSTGSYYTFVSRSLGGRSGFLVAWVYLLFYPVVIAQVGSFMGSTLQSTLKAEYGITFEWWWFMVFLIALVAYTAWRGVELSVNLIIVLGVIEGVIVLALGLWGLASPGPGGINLQWLTAAGHTSNLHGLFLGVVFAIFAITGWDAAAPLAEESRDPKRNIPRAVLGSIIILGVFLVVVSWGQITGWGTSRLGSFASSSELPAFVLGKKYWGDGWLIVLFALFNSAIAVSIACTNASVRFLYGMSRAKALPSSLTKIHGRFKTPTNAILVQTGINIALGLVLPLVIGVANVYNVTGTWFTFALAFVYIMANIGLFVYYRREHGDEFSWGKHLIVPAIGSVALAVVVYYSVVPLPPWPVSLAPFIVVGWLVIGGIVMAAVYRGSRAGNLALAGAAMGESMEEAIVERYSLTEPVPPPDAVR